MKNKYKLPRSYLLVPIATLFFVSQLILTTIGNITQLWIASLLLGLAYGSFYSLCPTICLEWFGVGTYLFHHSYSKSTYLSSVFPAHFSENWGYLGMSILVGGNIFPIVFGRNLDSHGLPSSSTNPVKCLNGLDCYVAAIYLTMAATFVSIILCAWAGYREKQKVAKSQEY